MKHLRIIGIIGIVHLLVLTGTVQQGLAGDRWTGTWLSRLTIDSPDRNNCYMVLESTEGFTGEVPVDQLVDMLLEDFSMEELVTMISPEAMAGLQQLISDPLTMFWEHFAELPPDVQALILSETNSYAASSLVGYYYYDDFEYQGVNTGIIYGAAFGPYAVAVWADMSVETNEPLHGIVYMEKLDPLNISAAYYYSYGNMVDFYTKK